MSEQAMKEIDDRLKWYLLPRSLERVVEIYTEGSKKYAERNWEKGRSFADGFGAMMRHAWAWFWRRSDGHQQGLHLASVAWWALALMEWEETHPEYDDRPYGVANGKGAS